MPVYNDGYFRLWKVETDESQDFPEDKLTDQNMEVWYREIAVYDRVRCELEQNDLEVTMKIRIPQYKKIGSKHVCVIDGQQHRVYNAAHIIDKNGFRETELTLVKPEREVQIHDKAGAE